MTALTSPQSVLGPITQIKAGRLEVGYVDTGPADGRAVLLLHGWPYDIHSYVDVVPLLVATSKPATTARSIASASSSATASTASAACSPFRNVSSAKKRVVPYPLSYGTIALCPEFDDATFERSAASFDNPDHVAIVVHNYRWRLGLADGEAHYSDVERRLAEGPAIGVPAITLEGDANGAPHLEPSAYAAKFSGRYEHRTIEGGVGHNLPQEAPEAFATAVLDVSGWA